MSLITPIQLEGKYVSLTYVLDLIWIKPSAVETPSDLYWLSLLATVPTRVHIKFSDPMIWLWSWALWVSLLVQGSDLHGHRGPCQFQPFCDPVIRKTV